MIKTIRKHDFDGFNNIKILSLVSNKIDRIEPGSLDFFGSVILKLSLTMPNISNENIYSIKDSLKPRLVRKFFHINYFAPTHIENRVDVDCVKTLYFMRFKILYNFFNEHIDINDFTTNCMNLSKVRNELNFIENSSNHLENVTQLYKKNHLNDSSKIFIIYLFIFASFIISIIYLIFYYFLKQFKAKNSQNEQKHAEDIELNSDLQVIGPAVNNSQSYLIKNENKNFNSIKANSSIVANLTVNTMFINRLLQKLKKKEVNNRQGKIEDNLNIANESKI